ncbi:hypothetical protein AB6805_03410 [Chitinophaga sp. RCC_12]|uniref:hypothetical protein n=1 Tax=Chitinophaga sp. RCC_12 TaxID=3239226 RepID=UPI0035269326
MTKIRTACLFLLLPLCAAAQKKKTGHPGSQDIIKVPLEAGHWSFQPGTVEFITYKSVPAMKLLNRNDTVVLKDLDFTNGTIEYDVQPVSTFTSFYFRRASRKENECFYFRTPSSGKGDAVQYAPHIDGVNLWDMLDQYQAAAWISKDDWNHVKLVISGRQMRVYVNDTSRPVLEVPRLESNTWHGGLAFDGQAVIANLVVKPDQTEGLPSSEGIDITNNDAAYLRTWQITQPMATPDQIDFSKAWIPGKETPWETIRAERRGLINVTRKFGGAENRTRRIVWLKTNIRSAVAQTRQLHLGFSDEVWVFVNDKFVYVDKNLYSYPLMKQPDGRCTVDNASFSLPLVAGDNEILIALANDFYGWGIMAKLDKFENMTFDK